MRIVFRKPNFIHQNHSCILLEVIKSEWSNIKWYTFTQKWCWHWESTAVLLPTQHSSPALFATRILILFYKNSFLFHNFSSSCPGVNDLIPLSDMESGPVNHSLTCHWFQGYSFIWLLVFNPGRDNRSRWTRGATENASSYHSGQRIGKTL